LKYLLIISLLLVGCVTPALATVDLQVTPVYQLLAWSPDETEILALSEFPLPDQITKTQLIMMKFDSFSSVIIEETEPHAIVNIKVIHWPSKTDPLALV
jgi:hypothetical protein